jgi:spore germination protein YaaH
MGYDYHWSGSDSGASSPLARLDGTLDLPWSIDEYVALGVPRERILLGLPLYGMSWPTDGPWRYAATVGKGSTWIPSRHLDELLADDFVAGFDPVEISEYFVAPSATGWQATFYDSPRSLRPKLELARESGLAGAGFWAMGYERGLPGYTELMDAFRAGSVGK